MQELMDTFSHDSSATQEISVYADILTEILSISSVISHLQSALNDAKYGKDMLEAGDTYSGQAIEEMMAFYSAYYSHFASLIGLYAKAIQYTVNSINAMVELEKEIALKFNK